MTRSLTPAPPPEGDPHLLLHHHRYELVASELLAPSGHVIARLAPVPLRRPVTVEKVWYDVRSSGNLDIVGPGSGHQLGLDLTLHRPPGGAGPSMLGMVKMLVDGVISALLAHDGTQLRLLAERLAERLSLPADHLAGLLADDAAAVLGQRRLLWPFRDFVQWNPADDAIVRLRVATIASPTWQLSGALTDLDRTASH